MQKMYIKMQSMELEQRQTLLDPHTPLFQQARLSRFRPGKILTILITALLSFVFLLLPNYLLIPAFYKICSIFSLREQVYALYRDTDSLKSAAGYIWICFIWLAAVVLLLWLLIVKSVLFAPSA
jgi:hypothetical protein